MARYITCVWGDGAFRPRKGFHLDRCEDDFGDGEILMVTVERERDMVSHRKQFGVIRTGWLNLPESMQGEEWAANPDKLRKHLLIAEGFCNYEAIPCGSKAAAERVAVILKREGTNTHGYCIATADGSVARYWTPHSQSVQQMGSKVFMESKAKITERLADMLGVTRKELEAMGRDDNAEAA